MNSEKVRLYDPVATGYVTAVKELLPEGVLTNLGEGNVDLILELFPLMIEPNNKTAMCEVFEAMPLELRGPVLQFLKTVQANLIYFIWETQDKIRSRPDGIYQLDVSGRAYHVIEDLDVNTIYELGKFTYKDLMKLDGVGRKTALEIINAVAKKQLSLGPVDPHSGLVIESAAHRVQ